MSSLLSIVRSPLSLCLAGLFFGGCALSHRPDGEVPRDGGLRDTDVEACRPGAVVTEPCGACGVLERRCDVMGRWVDGSCVEGGECVPGTTDSIPCGLCGTMTATCGASCTWTPDECRGEGVCVPGELRTTSDGCAVGEVRVFECDERCAFTDLVSPCARPCMDPTECSSGVCLDGACQPVSCADGVRNGGESDVDCGGVTMCPRCGEGRRCTAPLDCAASICTGMRCGAVTGMRTFTPCGATGALGPLQAACDAEYVGTSLGGAVRVGAGIQRWAVPATGTYHIEAFGAQGASAQMGQDGGRGAQVGGDFLLMAGTTLDILVGQRGTADDCSGGGGGGSWVVDAATEAILVVAGGGGGTRTSVMQDGCDGRISLESGTGSGAGSTHSCDARASGIGTGGVVSADSWGSGGGGHNEDGAADTVCMASSSDGGSSFRSGGAGGEGARAFGGFGGGGTGEGCCGGGGGGGYSGGDGGRVAGGGGSFNSGAAPIAVAGARVGDGIVTITSL